MKIILALRDVKSELFMQPFFVPTVGVAYRGLMDEIARQDKENPVSNHPEDFEVWQLGTFDEDLGIVDAKGFPVKLLDVVSLGPKAPKSQGALPLQ